jgi:hypothetical protein
MFIGYYTICMYIIVPPKVGYLVFHCLSLPKIMGLNRLFLFEVELYSIDLGVEGRGSRPSGFL